MYVHFFDQTLEPLATVHRIINGSVMVTANERGASQLTLPSTLLEMAGVTLVSGHRARIYDNAGRLRMNGYIASVHPGSNELTIEVVDQQEELRIMTMPPVSVMNGYFINLVGQILSLMPAVDNERWQISDSTKAINGWTTLDASRLSCFEALVTLCDQTGNWFRTRGRLIDLYAEPLQARPVRYIVQGQMRERTINAAAVSRIVQDVTLETVSDQIYAGIFPEGREYRDPNNISRVLRLTGDETVADGYFITNIGGYYGVFNRTKVASATAPYAQLPQGLVRCEVFSAIYPIINTDETIDVVVEGQEDMAIVSSSVDGYARDYWKDAKATFGDVETTVVASYANRITLATMLPVTIGDRISLSIFRAWDDAKLIESRQSLATTAAAFLQNRAEPQIALRIVVPSSSDPVMMPGDKVNIRYTGGAVVRSGNLDRYVSSMRISGDYAVAKVELLQEENAELDAITVSDQLWRWPSASGVKEIMAMMQRRLSTSGVSNG